ncbi:1-pyrroline-5-carboxylate dehydrogenase [Abditibacteriota bacterium]|nr:1-pyrroline-5-carboxylate dehydrogenase [Abditibacteriota bacterium]
MRMPNASVAIRSIPIDLPVTKEGPERVADETIALATQLLEAAHKKQSSSEKREASQMARLMDDVAGKAFLFAMVDETFRASNPRNTARRWRGILRDFGVPQYPAFHEKAMMQLGSLGSLVLPQIVMPLVQATMRAQTSRVILSGEEKALHDFLDRRKKEGFSINLNQLGEAVLGEAEANHRLEQALRTLARPDVNYISIKISAIFSQINLLAWDDTLHEIKERLRKLYRVALEQHKFVNLDMEEYRDLALTIAAFKEVMDESEFHKLEAGIVLQAYLPDSFGAQQGLVAWARERIENGGAGIKIRLVKGANLAMERVEAELHGWHPAPYASKPETDANFRRMLEWGCQPENARVARLGVASHNLFDVALALILREKMGVRERVEIEMLEGMAPHQARVVKDEAGGLLLYAPVVKRDDFLSALAYLIRRLDENTSAGNFLRDSFGLTPDSEEWHRQREAFVWGWENRHTIFDGSARALPATQPTEDKFDNAADSDWTQKAVRDELWETIHAWQVPSLPALPNVETVIETAVKAQGEWEKAGIVHRATILRRAAQVMSDGRFAAIACMREDAKKAIPEADAEVSEAIDFARYYADHCLPDGIEAKALGVVVVTPPWNFPYAIPCGGVLAALVAGNSVILKPAPETAQTAYLLAQQLWEAGVPTDVLQFFACQDGETGKALIGDSRVGAIILTGSVETARFFQRERPTMRLFAETSGKNALVITAQADREAAIKDLVKSAFGHAGQKCSAASLAIVEAEVYDSPDFRRQLRDCAASLFVGPSTDPRSVVTPTVQKPSESLLRALTTLDEGEEWLLEPKQIGEDPCLWSPGIKLGVREGSWFHRTECFGPVLGVMRASTLSYALKLQNATAFGLTAGIHSLDPRQVSQWREKVEAGNLYINRGTTGAIVRRQPFGGWKASSVGPGAKAGGPNYVWSFCTLRDAANSPSDFQASYKYAWESHFSLAHDPSELHSESNVFRYRPCRGVVLRLESHDQNAIERAKLAAELAGVSLTISIKTEESDADFIASLPALFAGADRLRTVEVLGDEVMRAANETGFNWIEAPFTSNGRLELRFWLREQAVSQTRHRYGQISEFAPESRQMGL